MSLAYVCLRLADSACCDKQMLLYTCLYLQRMLYCLTEYVLAVDILLSRAVIWWLGPSIDWGIDRHFTWMLTKSADPSRRPISGSNYIYIDQHCQEMYSSPITVFKTFSTSSWHLSCQSGHLMIRALNRLRHRSPLLLEWCIEPYRALYNNILDFSLAGWLTGLMSHQHPYNIDRRLDNTL